MTETGTSVRPSIGVGCVVFDDLGRVLLVCRNQPPHAGGWHIPGGRLESGETLLECCRREVMEETGIEVIPGAIVALADRSIEGFHYVIIDFLAELVTGSRADPLPSSDARDARWVHPDSLNELPLVEGLETVIHLARSYRANPAEGGLCRDAQYNWLFVPDITPGKKMPGRKLEG